MGDEEDSKEKAREPVAVTLLPGPSQDAFFGKPGGRRARDYLAS